MAQTGATPSMARQLSSDRLADGKNQIITNILNLKKIKTLVDDSPGSRIPNLDDISEIRYPVEVQCYSPKGFSSWS